MMRIKNNPRLLVNTGLSLALFFSLFLSSCNSGSALPSDSEVLQGTDSNYQGWLELGTLEGIAISMLHYKDKNASTKVERIFVYKDKGVLVYTFKDNNWQVQIDAATGRVLKIEEKN